MDPAIWKMFFPPFLFLLSLCLSDLHFSFSIFAFCASDLHNFAIFAVRYRRFGSVNFVAYLRGISCFAAPFCFSCFLLPVSGFCLESVRDGSTFAVYPVLWRGRSFRCVAGAIRAVRFHGRSCWTC